MNYSGDCGPRYTDKCCGCMLLAAGEIRHTADNTGLQQLKKKKRHTGPLVKLLRFMLSRCSLMIR